MLRWKARTTATEEQRWGLGTAVSEVSLLCQLKQLECQEMPTMAEKSTASLKPLCVLPAFPAGFSW